MADQKEAAAKSAEATAKRVEEASKRMGGKPTPTQEELDRAALGEYIGNHEDDGSGPDPRAPEWHKAKVSEAQGGQAGGYQTRAARPVSPTSTRSE